MRSLHTLTGLLLVIGVTLVSGQAPLPRDIYPQTGNRFPAIKPDAPDSFGPGAIRLYSPPVAESMTAVNDVGADLQVGPKPKTSEFAAIQNQEHAPLCSTCGSLMIRSASCYKCQNC